MNNKNDIAIRLKLLRLLKDNPQLTQRQMNQQMGISLGKINYCLSELAREGLIKVENFQKTQKKSSYIYFLTPRGIEEIARLTFNFLKTRIKEYDQIKMEISSLSEKLNEIAPDLLEDSGLSEALKKIQR